MSGPCWKIQEVRHFVKFVATEHSMQINLAMSWTLNLDLSLVTAFTSMHTRTSSDGDNQLESVGFCHQLLGYAATASVEKK